VGPPDTDGSPSAGDPCQPRCLGLTADVVQRPCAGAVSVEGAFMDLLTRLREWGRRGCDVSATPTLPTAWLLMASAADLIQRPGARMVSTALYNCRQYKHYVDS
jgi:hypothetical protein